MAAEDESIFQYEVKISRVWAKRGSTPRRIVTGSKAKTCVYGTVTQDGRQLFRQYPVCNSDHFLPYLKALQRAFGPLILFLDRATWHKKAKRVAAYVESQRAVLRVIWLPPGWPELNPVEECWRQGKNDDGLGGTLHPTFGILQRAITTYYRTQRFKLNLEHYLCR